ncbi:unnamed protein product, partial [Choristocarpus tenellus]
MMVHHFVIWLFILLQEEVALVEANVLEAAMHRATETNRFCSECKHNVVQSYQILMGHCCLEHLENGHEFNEELFRNMAGCSTILNGDREVLLCDTDDVEDLMYWHEEFDAQSYSNTGQRHAATLHHGQREIRSILGGVLLSQLRTLWHSHTSRVQCEQFLFCLVVDAIRTALAVSGANPGEDNAFLVSTRDHLHQQQLLLAEESSIESVPGCSSSLRGVTEESPVGVGAGRRAKRKKKKKKDKRKAGRDAAGGG